MLANRDVMNIKIQCNYFRLLILTCLLLLISSCEESTLKSGKKVNESLEKPIVIEEPFVIEDITTDPQDNTTDTSENEETTNGVVNTMPPPRTDQNETLENYAVKLEANKSLKQHERGVLKVWIGADTNIEFKSDQNIVQDTASIPNRGNYAKITPFSAGFDFNPVSRECVLIDPAGSEVQFTLIPKGSGELSVSADIYLFKESDCSDNPFPRVSETLKVVVEVDHKKNFMDKLGDLWEVFWEKFLTFWGGLITIILSAILFIVRSKINKKTGYSKGK